MKTSLLAVILILFGMTSIFNPSEVSDVIIGLGVLALGVFLLWRKRTANQSSDSGFMHLRWEDIDSMSGIEFEHYVGRLLRERGFDVEVTPGSGDFGADIIATQNHVKTAIQVKRYSVGNSVPVHAVTEAVAAIPYYDCDEALVITSGYFTAPAILYANKAGCQLVDRDTLAVWIRESERRHNIEPRKRRVYEPSMPIEPHEVISDDESESGLRPWIPGHRDGFVINTGTPPRPGNVLVHTAKCHVIQQLASGRFKISAPDLDSVESWGHNHLQTSPRKCGICLRSVVTSTS